MTQLGLNIFGIFNFKNFFSIFEFLKTEKDMTSVLNRLPSNKVIIIVLYPLGKDSTCS